MDRNWRAHARPPRHRSGHRVLRSSMFDGIPDRTCPIRRRGHARSISIFVMECDRVEAMPSLWPSFHPSVSKPESELLHQFGMPTRAPSALAGTKTAGLRLLTPVAADAEALFELLDKTYRHEITYHPAKEASRSPNAPRRRSRAGSEEQACNWIEQPLRGRRAHFGQKRSPCVVPNIKFSGNVCP